MAEVPPNYGGLSLPADGIAEIQKWADRLEHKAAHAALEKVHRILGDPGAVIATARAWEKAGSDLTNAMQYYDTMTAKLFAAWEGTAHDTFKTYMQDVSNKTSNNVNALDEVASELVKSYTTVIETYGKAIEEIGNAASSLASLIGGDDAPSGGGGEGGGGSAAKGSAWAAAAQAASKILSKFAKGIAGWLKDGQIKVGQYSVSLTEIEKRVDRLQRPSDDPLV